MKKDCGPDYPDHSAEMGRLNRVSGQVEGIKKMITERRYCPDIMTQIRATRAALKAIEANLLEAHLRGCVSEVLKSGNNAEKEKKVFEIKEIFKRFKD